MDTHEHLIPDEDLPGHGMILPEFARERIRELEENGMLLWKGEDDGYEPSAKMILGAISMGIAQAAEEIAPDADLGTITETVIRCLPWAAGCTAVEVDNLPPGFIFEDAQVKLDPNAAKVDVPDTFPEEWSS